MAARSSLTLTKIDYTVLVGLVGLNQKMENGCLQFYLVRNQEMMMYRIYRERV